jgi:uncharacterized protein YbjT (DUF2867 family)
MIGSATLIECLEHPDIEGVLVVGRRSCGVQDERVREVLHEDFLDLSSIADLFQGHDALLFCLGVSAAGMSEEEYTRITDGFTMAAAKAFFGASPDGTFCYISGEGADSTESSRVMWARVRGRLENKLLALDHGPVWIFRPGFVQPTKGVRSATTLYDMIYRVSRPLFPLLNRLIPDRVTASDRLGLALVRTARSGAPANYLHNREINALAAAERVELAGR